MDDTTYVPLNDVYYRRFLIPVLMAVLLFVGCFLIIRGSPGIEWMPTGGNQFGGSASMMVSVTKYLRKNGFL